MQYTVEIRCRTESQDENTEISSRKGPKSWKKSFSATCPQQSKRASLFERSNLETKILIKYLKNLKIIHIILSVFAFLLKSIFFKSWLKNLHFLYHVIWIRETLVHYNQAYKNPISWTFDIFRRNRHALQQIATISCIHKLRWILYNYPKFELDLLSTSGDILRQSRFKTLGFWIPRTVCSQYPTWSLLFQNWKSL